jgi:hypothetical protein
MGLCRYSAEKRETSSLVSDGRGNVVIIHMQYKVTEIIHNFLKCILTYVSYHSRKNNTNKQDFENENGPNFLYDNHLVYLKKKLLVKGFPGRKVERVLRT